MKKSLLILLLALSCNLNANESIIVKIAITECFGYELLDTEILNVFKGMDCMNAKGYTGIIENKKIRWVQLESEVKNETANPS